MPVYKILRADEWRTLQAAGRSVGSPDDVRDGYIHLSTAAQIEGTLSRHFAGEDGLWLLKIEEAALGSDLCWEPARGGTLFPHLYRVLELRDVARAEPVHRGRPMPFGLP